MPKKLLTITISTFLAIAILSSVTMVSANFLPLLNRLDIQDASGGNMTYSLENGHSISLWIQATVALSSPAVTSITYSLDGGYPTTIYNLTHSNDNPSKISPKKYYNTNVTLDNLSNGNHTLKADARDTYANVMSAVKYFTVTNSSVSNSTTPSTSPIPPMDNFASNSLVIISLVVIVAVTLVSLVYFRRRKGKP